MARYVNATKLTEHIEAEMRKHGDEYGAYQILADIEDFPTADVREVILCKDCKYASPYWMEGTIFCEDSGCRNFEDGFCNYAERRGDE